MVRILPEENRCSWSPGPGVQLTPLKCLGEIFKGIFYQLKTSVFYPPKIKLKTIQI